MNLLRLFISLVFACTAFAAVAQEKTPMGIVDRFAKAAIEVIRAPDMKQRQERMGLEPQ